jgi:hypothetical protein
VFQPNPYAPYPTSDCFRCRRYGTLDHDRHEQFGRGKGTKRKRCEICGIFLPNRVRSPFCERDLTMVRREKNYKRALRNREAPPLQPAWGAPSAPSDRRREDS